jgi:putative membrane protein
MMYWGNGAIGGWGIFGMVLMVVFWIAVIVLVVWGIKRFTQETTATTSKGALDIAKERYAKGEISKEEFEQIKRDLS